METNGCEDGDREQGKDENPLDSASLLHQKLQNYRINHLLLSGFSVKKRICRFLGFGDGDGA